MSISVVATVCSIATQISVCRDVKIPMNDAVTEIHICQLKAQTVLAPWVVDNPGWWITRYKCVDDMKKEQEA
jgi:hypothetical protein